MATMESAPIVAVSAADAAAVAARLDAGEVIVAPTDTVYGLLGRAAPSSVRERIIALKGRPAEKALPFLIPDRRDIELFAQRVPVVAERVMDAFWPGAMTLVVGPDPGVAVRLPDDEFLRSVLRHCAGPVHATSANVSGRPPVATAQEAQRILGAGVSLILDGGPRRSSASTIVRVAPDGRRGILRPGSASGPLLAHALRLEIVFVCTGNTCRSPMAEALAKVLFARALDVTADQLGPRGVVIGSAGLAATEGAAISPGAGRELSRRGVEHSRHRATGIGSVALSGADIVFVMTESHRAALLDRFPALEPRVRLLDPDDRDVDDPFGGGGDVYARSAEQISRALGTRFVDLLSWVPRLAPDPA